MIRKNYYLKESASDFVKLEATRMGISQSATIALIIEFYSKKFKSTEAFPEIGKEPRKVRKD